MSFRNVFNLKMNGLKASLERNFIFLLGVTALFLSGMVIFVVIVHFQLGGDLWFFEIKNSGSAQFWGQIGDFIGGLLNPILSFFALMAVLFNLVLQRNELTLARRDAADAHATQKRQSETFEVQNFESVFFRLLESHSKLAFSVRTNVGKYTYTGMEGFDQAVTYYLPKVKKIKVDEVDFVKGGASLYVDANVEALGHYFRNLYQILKYIDGYGQVPSDVSGGTLTDEGVRRAIANYSKQRMYSNILLAQLSNSEIACVFLNCLTGYGGGLKNYIEKYSFLKTLKFPSGYGWTSIKPLYSNMAYSGLEGISDVDIELISRKICERRTRKMA